MLFGQLCLPTLTKQGGKPVEALEKNGFRKLTYDEKEQIVAAGWWSGLLSFLGPIGSFLNKAVGGPAGFLNLGTSLLKMGQQNNFVSSLTKKMPKGEIEFGKDGQIKLKWDGGSNGDHSTIIF